MQHPFARPTMKYRIPECASRLPFGSLRSALTRSLVCGFCPLTQAKGSHKVRLAIAPTHKANVSEVAAPSASSALISDSLSGAITLCQSSHSRQPSGMVSDSSMSMMSVHSQCRRHQAAECRCQRSWVHHSRRCSGSRTLDLPHQPSARNSNPPPRLHKPSEIVQVQVVGSVVSRREVLASAPFAANLISGQMATRGIRPQQRPEVVGHDDRRTNELAFATLVIQPAARAEQVGEKIGNRSWNLGVKMGGIVSWPCFVYHPNADSTEGKMKSVHPAQVSLTLVCFQTAAYSQAVSYPGDGPPSGQKSI
jgi:hypothetical protein